MRRRDRTSCRERLGHESGVIRPRREVQILARGLDVRVAHPLLDADDVCLADQRRPERVAEVVEAEWARYEPVKPGNTSASSPLQCSRCESRASASATAGAIGTDRTLPLFGDVSAPFV